MKKKLLSKHTKRRCAVVVSGQPGKLFEGITARLNAQGLSVDVLTSPLKSPTDPYDLIILRAKDELVTNWSQLQQARGSVVVPDPRVIRMVKDRWVCRQFLYRTGIQFPPAISLKPCCYDLGKIQELFPIVLKRRFLHGEQVKVISNISELFDELAEYPTKTELVAESYIEGIHFTVCFIGSRMFCFTKQPLDHGIENAVPIKNLPISMLEWVKRYQKATRLYFGKLDFVIQTDLSVFVVDCGVSPNLWQISEAEDLLCEYFQDLLFEESTGWNSGQQFSTSKNLLLTQVASYQIFEK